MARYWATSGWTRLSICVLLDGSITSLWSAPCASAVSAALCWLLYEHYTIKIHPVCRWGGGRAAVRHVIHSLELYTSFIIFTCVRRRVFTGLEPTLQLWSSLYISAIPFCITKIRIETRVHISWGNGRNLWGGTLVPQGSDESSVVHSVKQPFHNCFWADLKADFTSRLS